MLRQHLTRIAGFVWALYVFSFMIMMPYYNWTFAKENGFVSWMFFGEVVATCKAIVWPYFVLSQNSSSRLREAVSSFDKVMDYSRRIAEDVQKYKGNPNAAPADVLAADDNLGNRIISEGGAISIKDLNSVYPDLGTHFSAEFLQGVRLNRDSADIASKSGASSEALSKYEQSLKLEQQWVSWFNGNLESINAALRPHR